MLDRVPYEIFSKIVKFSYTSCSFRSFNCLLDYDEMSVPPIKATHVCRSWRTALLSDPTMWTSVILTENVKVHLDQLNETLHRSGSCPLHVLVDHWDDPLDPYLIVYLWHMLSVVSQQMHRCRQLQIVISAQLAPFVSHCLDKPAPMLQKFYLNVFDDEGNFKSKDMLKGIHEILFSGHAPNLEYARLQISGGLDNLQLSLFKNLSSLYLSFVSDTIIHGDVLLDIFQSSPYLRMLNILWNFISQEPVLSMLSSRRVLLPHLRDLSLRGNCRVNLVNLILGHLEFPMENIKFNITCNDSHPRISGSTLLLRFLSQRRLTFVSISFNTSGLIIDFYEKMDREYADSEFRAVYNYTRAPPSLEGPPKFMRMFNLSDITHMSHNCLSLKYVILRSILVSLPNLRHLRIHHGNLDELFSFQDCLIQCSYLKALLPRRQRSSPRARASSELDTDDSDTTDSESNFETYQGQLFPCPSLRTLELLFSYETLPVRLDKAYLPALVRCSRIREQAGYPLKYIADCRKSLDLAEDIEAWLQAHEGFPIEVRAAR